MARCCPTPQSSSLPWATWARPAALPSLWFRLVHTFCQIFAIHTISSCVTKTFWNFYSSRGQIFKCKSREIHFKDLPISLKIKEGIYRIIIWKQRFFVWQLFKPFSDPPCSSSCMLEHFESSKFSGKSSSAAWQKDGTAACQSALILSRAHQPDFPSNQCKRYYTNIGKYRSVASLNNCLYVSYIQLHRIKEEKVCPHNILKGIGKKHWNRNMEVSSWVRLSWPTPAEGMSFTWSDDSDSHAAVDS